MLSNLIHQKCHLYLQNTFGIWIFLTTSCRYHSHPSHGHFSPELLQQPHTHTHTKIFLVSSLISSNLYPRVLSRVTFLKFRSNDVTSMIKSKYWSLACDTLLAITPPNLLVTPSPTPIPLPSHNEFACNSFKALFWTLAWCLDCLWCLEILI